MNVTVKLIPDKLGPLKIPISYTISGSLEPPTQAVLLCDAIGRFANSSDQNRAESYFFSSFSISFSLLIVIFKYFFYAYVEFV